MISFLPCSCARAASLICATSLFLQPIARAQTPPAAPPTAPVLNEVHGLNPTNVAFLLAATCKKENWVAFSKWTKTSGFFKQELKAPIKFSSNKEGLKAEGFDLQAKYATAKGLEITYKGSTQTAPDACAAVVAAFPSLAHSPAKKSALVRSLLPDARAEEQIFREEGKDADALNALNYAALGAIAILAAPAFAGTAAVAVLAAGTYGLYMSYSNFTSAKSKETFDEIMNTMIGLTCNKAGALLKTPNYRVSIRKVPPPAKLDVYEAESGATAKFINSDYAKKSRDTILSLANRCESAEDAEKIMKQYKELRDQSSAKVVAAEEGRTPGTAPAAAAPAATSKERAPQSKDDTYDYNADDDDD